MSIGTFMLVKNEAPWIGAHILNVLPWVDEMVFYDGNSMDGTLDIIEVIKAESPEGRKIKLYRNADPKDLCDDYVRLFSECMRELSTDLAWFLHPDMCVINPEQISNIANSDAVAMTTSIRSFGGEPDGVLFEIEGGRMSLWKNIYRLHNPDMGAHYFGHYGAWNEDVYFSEITGGEHDHHGHNMDRYPYDVHPSGLYILHFSDVRTYERRLGRMTTCLKNQGMPQDLAAEVAAEHPRVTLKPGTYRGVPFNFITAEWPAKMVEDRNKYKHLERALVKA